MLLLAGLMQGLATTFRQAVLRVNQHGLATAAIYLIAALAGRVGSFLVIPLYTRKLTQEEYGTYGLIVSLLSLLPLCFCVGLNAGLTKVYFDTPTGEDPKDHVGGIAKGMICVATVFALLTVAAVFLVFPQGTLKLSPLQLTLVVLATLGTSYLSVPDLYLRASQRPMWVATLQLSNLGLLLGSALVLVGGLNRGLSGVVEAIFISGCFSATVGLFFTLRMLGGKIDWTQLRKTFRFSAPFIFHYGASWAQMTGDRWVLSAFNFDQTLGAYFLAQQLTMPIAMAVVAWNDAEVPRMGQSYKKYGLAHLRQKFKTYTLHYAWVAGIVSLALVLGRPIWTAIIGSRFESTMTILPWLALIGWIDAFYYPGSNLVFYTGKTYWIPVVTTLAAAVSIGLSILLLPRWGLPGLITAKIAASLVRSVVISVAARFASVETASLDTPQPLNA